MKRIGAFSLAIFILVLSVFSVVPVNVYADDATTLSKPIDQNFAYSASEAQSYVTPHKDIYDSNHLLLFAFTPGASYNWTLCKNGNLTGCHLSDKQVANVLCSKNPFSENVALYTGALANTNIVRGIYTAVGALVTKDSDVGTKILDTITGNYNYLDALSYDEDSQTITMSNDNGSVDKLREEIKKYYYDSIGLIRIKPSGTVKQYVDSSAFHHLFEYEEDYTSAFNGVLNSKFCFADKDSNLSYHAFFWDTTKYVYMSDDVAWAGDSLGNRVYKLMSYDGENSFDFSTDNVKYCSYYGNSSDLAEIKGLYTNKNGSYYNGFYGLYDNTVRYYSFFSGVITFKYYPFSFYSADGSYFEYFKSYSALYNFLHGDQNAYLSSKIEETGKDISYSIKDMNENLGTKMDELIDSINSGKGNMSADELQNAIDKGLEDLNKNTEDIKDNTSDILEVLKEQNNILLQILGVTEYIAYQTTKDDGSSYTKTDLTNTINKIYNGLGNAILYGKNTLTDSGDNSGAASQSSIVIREDFKLSNNIYTSSGSGVSPGTPVVAYSLDDYSVYDDSNDYDVGIASQDINNMDIHDGLFGKFPFSVPYQLYEWLQVLQADPVAPKLVYNYGFLLGHKDEQKYDLVIDFSIYEPWANVCKSFLRLSFTLFMAVFIFRHFSNNKGGGVL